MIPARRSRAFTWWFARHAERRIEAHFGAVRVRGLGTLQRALARGPVLVVSNHTSWWDALVVLRLGVRALHAETYAMMNAENLRRLPFFALVGAFGVDRGALDGARAVRHAARLLDRPGRLVWIFAQGRETPVTARPLGFHGGSVAIGRLAPRASVIPLALRYEHGEEAEPVVWISMGEPLRNEAHEEAVTAELDRIESALGASAADFEPLFQRGASSWMRIAERALAWITRPFALPRERDSSVGRQA